MFGRNMVIAQVDGRMSLAIAGNAFADRSSGERNQSKVESIFLI
jgi:hypothetical protein